MTDTAKTKQARVIKGDIFGKYDITEHVAVRDRRASGKAGWEALLSFVGSEIVTGTASKRRCEDREMFGTQL